MDNKDPDVIMQDYVLEWSEYNANISNNTGTLDR
jgi:hypothetical protein